ncbi:MAG: hypothetical protein ACLQBL_41140 [Polyangiaceae bacterium]
METILVRLKPYDPRRKFVLRRYVYAGIHFLVTRGWERVPKAVGDYLRDVRQKEFDPYSPPAFDVCTEAEAAALEKRERELSGARRTALDAIPVVEPRRVAGVVTTADLPGARVVDEDETTARPRGRRGEARR